MTEPALPIDSGAKSALASAVSLVGSDSLADLLRGLFAVWSDREETVLGVAVTLDRGGLLALATGADRISIAPVFEISPDSDTETRLAETIDRTLRQVRPRIRVADREEQSPDLEIIRVGRNADGKPVGVLVFDGTAPETVHRSLLDMTASLLGSLAGRLPAGDGYHLPDHSRLEALAEFAAGAGHDINNPLAAISGRTQLLLREIEQPAYRAELETIGAQVLRIRDMIGDVMTFARPPRLSPEPLDLSGFLVKLREQTREEFERAEVDANWVIPHDLRISADRTALAIILHETIRNAIAACEPGSHVTIEACPLTDRHVTVSVSDNGPGLDPIAQQHLFDPFYSARQAGRGLGFGLCKIWRLALAGGMPLIVEEPTGNDLDTGLCLTLHCERIEFETHMA